MGRGFEILLFMKINLTFWRVSFYGFLLAAATTVLAQNRTPDFSKVEITETPVAGNIHLLEGAGGNISASVGPDGILIVDDEFLPLAEKIDAALGKLSDKPLQYVVNTHVHGDHVGGNAYFGKKAKIIASANLHKRLAAQTNAVPEALPVITYTHDTSLYFNGEEVRIIAFGPGHTDGDSAVYFTDSKVLHLGDQFVNGRFPYVDVANGGDVKGYLNNLDSVLAWVPADMKIIPGHGVVSTVDDLKKFRDFIAESIAVVQKDINDGKTLDQIKGDSDFLDKYKEWRNGGRWLEAVYKSLNAK
jgi:glyoxylase-like metal-dependent hydrolase (beta-lactamase superfamily II)